MPASKDFQPTPNRPIALGQQYQKRLSPELPADLGKCIHDDFSLLEELGWFFFRSKRGSSDFGSLNFNHPEKRLLKNCKIHGAPVKIRTKRWNLGRLRRALCRGTHNLTYEYLDFTKE